MSFLIVPIFIVVYFAASSIRKVFAKISLPLFVKYFTVGIFFSLLTEFFVTRDQLALFSQNIPADLFLSIGIYGAIIVIWYKLLRHYQFSIWGVFAMAGLWGIMFEQNFKILLSFNPIAYLYVFLVYGSLAAIPFTIFKNDFQKISRDNRPRKYPIAFLAQCITYPVGFLWIAFFRIAFHIT